MPYSAKPQSIIDIDARLSELEDEKNQLLALREQLQQPSPIAPDSKFYTPKQKIAIFRGLFRGRTDIFATAGKTNKVAVVTLSPAITSGYRVSATNHASNAKTAITDNSQS